MAYRELDPVICRLGNEGAVVSVIKARTAGPTVIATPELIVDPTQRLWIGFGGWQVVIERHIRIG